MAWEPDYVTLSEAKSYLRITDADDDVMLGIWITTASRAVDTFCHRQFGKVDTPEARTFTPTWDAYCLGGTVDLDDLADADDLAVVDGNGLTLTSYTLGPANSPQKGRPYERMTLTATGPLVITGTWGWPAVPQAVKAATLLQTARFAARRDSPYGIAGSPSEGSEQRLLATLDPDVKVSLGSKYRREWWAA